jgi:hypothetical protein
MKKLVAVLAAAVLAGGAIFAGDFYNGDIQLQAGVGFDTVKAEDLDRTIKGTIFDFGVESWHLFKPIDLIGVGFSVGFNGGIGATEQWPLPYSGFGVEVKPLNGLSGNFNFAIGPAVGLYLGNVVRFGVNFGFDAGFSIDEPLAYEYEVSTGYYSSSSGTARATVFAAYSGIDFGIQAKFLPESVVNPVIGWRLVKGSASSYDYSVSQPGDTYENGTMYRKYDFTQNVLYVALSFSW